MRDHLPRRRPTTFAPFTRSPTSWMLIRSAGDTCGLGGKAPMGGQRRFIYTPVTDHSYIYHLALDRHTTFSSLSSLPFCTIVFFAHIYIFHFTSFARFTFTAVILLIDYLPGYRYFSQHSLSLASYRLSCSSSLIARHMVAAVNCTLYSECRLLTQSCKGAAGW